MSQLFRLCPCTWECLVAAPFSPIYFQIKWLIYSELFELQSRLIDIRLSNKNNRVLVRVYESTDRVQLVYCLLGDGRHLVWLGNVLWIVFVLLSAVPLFWSLGYVQRGRDAWKFFASPTVWNILGHDWFPPLGMCWWNLAAHWCPSLWLWRQISGRTIAKLSS